MTRQSSQFPALREFFRGYFHQDLEEEYGSAEAAARQFWRDADEGQRRAVAEEWDRLLRHTETGTLDHINKLLKKSGSAWTFASLAEVQKVSDVFREDPAAR